MTAPSMMRRFDKYEGLGNDFVVLDGARWTEAEVTPALAQRLCDRHTAIGADGVLWVGGARMVIYNADGSRPETCGNGLRCVAKLAVDRGHVTTNPFVIETDAGPREAHVERGARGVVHATIEMGRPRIVARENLRLWHSLGSVLYLLQWACAGLALWKSLPRRAG